MPTWLLVTAFLLLCAAATASSIFYFFYFHVTLDKVSVMVVVGVESTEDNHVDTFALFRSGGRKRTRSTRQLTRCGAKSQLPSCTRYVKHAAVIR